jgi:8-oxo-dGTP diphosphatase
MAAAPGSPAPAEVVAAVLVRDSRVLLCHRSPDRQWYPDAWDFPGGHVEAGEPPPQALRRELYEELGIVVEEPTVPELARIVTDEFDLRLWLVEQWNGAIVNASPAEHDELAWFQATELKGRRLAHKDYLSVIARALAAATSGSD